MTMLSDGMLMTSTALATGPSAIAFVSSSQLPNANAGTTITIPAPSDIMAGDLIIAFIYPQNTSGSATISSRPAGFTNVFSRSDADGRNFFVEIKIATGSEPDDYSWTTSSAVSLRNGALVVYRGATGVDVVSPAATGPVSSTTINVAGITATQAGALIAVSFAQSSTRTVTTGPAGMTARSPQPPAIGVYDLIPSPPGSTGTRTFVWSSSTSLYGFLLQIY